MGRKKNLALKHCGFVLFWTKFPYDLESCVPLFFIFKASDAVFQQVYRQNVLTYMFSYYLIIQTEIIYLWGLLMSLNMHLQWLIHIFVSTNQGVQ